MATKYSPTIGTEHVVLIFVTQYITSLTVWTPENILNYSLLGLNLNWHSEVCFLNIMKRNNHDKTHHLAKLKAYI